MKFATAIQKVLNSKNKVRFLETKVRKNDQNQDLDPFCPFLLERASFLSKISRVCKDGQIELFLPGRDFFHPGRDFLDPGRDFFDPGRDFNDPGRDFVHPGDSQAVFCDAKQDCLFVSRPKQGLFNIGGE